MTHDSVDVYGLIGEHWPYDGPHTDQKIRDAGAVASGLVRYMNNATHRPLEFAATVDSVLGSLAGVAYGLDQLVTQLQATLRHHAEEPSLYDDRHDRPARDTALAADAALDDVLGAAGMLAASLDRARAHAAHLGNETGRIVTE